MLDRVTTAPIVLIGTSMGAAIALQAAAKDRRTAAIVAVSPFSDLRTAASERGAVLREQGEHRRGVQAGRGAAASSASTTSTQYRPPPTSPRRR